MGQTVMRRFGRMEDTVQIFKVYNTGYQSFQEWLYLAVAENGSGSEMESG